MVCTSNGPIMRQPYALTMKDLAPVARMPGLLVRQQVTAFVAIGEHLEEHQGNATAERAVSQFVTNRTVRHGPVAPASLIQLVLLLLFFEENDQGRGRELPNPERLPAGGQTQARWPGGFCPCPHYPPGKQLACCSDPFTAGQLGRNLRLVERGQSREIVAVQFLGALGSRRS